MSCIITDVVMELSALNVAVPKAGAIVLVSPTQRPLFINPEAAFREIFQPVRELITDSQGLWSVVLPWPTEQDPSVNSWVIQLPDGSRWQGDVPQDIAGPVTLWALKQSYDWALVEEDHPTGSRLIPVAIQGPVGPQGPAGAAVTLPTLPDPDYNKRLFFKPSNVIVWQQVDQKTAVFDGTVGLVHIDWTFDFAVPFKVSATVRESSDLVEVIIDNVDSQGCDVIVGGTPVCKVDVTAEETIS